ncbi:uncharacterized protein LOC112085210 isoform X2 [Eutrema salsugineum]|uniref:uncharacterized protein LOC112085210 isoform X2 n=1 Tax=Eutrema salsugineum TaxID=72664 RepID=UPI000CED0E09|nr:uncharacterized protein LOC112085210 isoform X2 [Eutrema salsugineum]
MDKGWVYAEATYGIPDKYFCGKPMKLESFSQGRKYYICPDWMIEVIGEHMWQWWDEDVTEQIGILERRLDAQKELILSETRPWINASDTTHEELQQDLRRLEGEVSMLKQNIGNQGYFSMKGILGHKHFALPFP